MPPHTIILPPEDSVRREIRAKKIMTFLAGLDPKRPWEIIVRPFKRSRSNQQNRYERGVACKLLSEATGYEIDEVHEYLVGTYFGWRQIRCPKTPSNPRGLRDVPIRTTTTNDLGQRDVLSKSDYSDFIAFVQRFGAKHGVLIPEPEPDFALRADREEKAA